MLNGMYELGKFWIHEENMEKIEIVLDANKLNNTKKVLFVDKIILYLVCFIHVLTYKYVVKVLLIFAF